MEKALLGEAWRSWKKLEECTLNSNCSAQVMVQYSTPVGTCFTIYSALPLSAPRPPDQTLAPF